MIRWINDNFKTGIAVFTLLAVFGCGHNSQKDWPDSFGYGKTASKADIIAKDIDVRPDGVGLPKGAGRIDTGALIFAEKCAMCHGVGGKLVKGQKLPAPALVSDTNFVKRKGNTVGNYWPYATTLFDYVRRSMPYNAPGSLTNQEVYDITAYLLYANGVIKKGATINAQTLPKVVMPARKYFVNDDRRGGNEVR
ncbi:c-type cytochrome [Mucilaginibacter pallidiroseus]|uniref:C-type cytochrome n=1 Tax=Mucilaginibacter pallidiroseus TaxID=2599295 RepID=A0A563U1L9_9SPHI|nr:cytochrome c [Mucilaginibacter pallidiroseus]TWR24731.1 c-type cytochrome [Mucilaginibacter pallidiroseus]